MAEDVDDLLMARLARGEIDALAGLIDRHQTAAVRYCTRCVGDFHIAEEVAQEAFLRVVQGAPAYHPQARFTTFLYRILTRLCIDELRHRNQKKRLAARLEGVPVEDLAGEVADPRAFPPPRELEGKEDVRRLWREVDRLPPDQKTALLLRELEAKNYLEIAEILGCPLDNVKVLLHLARKRLMEAMSVREAAPAPEQPTRTPPRRIAPDPRALLRRPAPATR